MKICSQCHTENPPEANFCTSCRALLDQRAHAYCEKGHAIDPNWTECYQCRVEQQAERAGSGGAAVRTPTLFEGGPQGAPGQRPTLMETPSRVQREGLEPPMRTPAPLEPGLPGAPGQRPTLMETTSRVQREGLEPPVRASGTPTPPMAAPRHVTQFAGEPAAKSEPGAAPNAVKKSVRRIVGVLITYTWRPEGQVFAVREGRNLIGRNPDKCEIALPEDSHLSEVNSHITFRRSFTLGDMVSMGGTDLNGAPVEENFVHLPNYSEIRTGATHWTFIMAERGNGEGTGSSGGSGTG